MGNSYSWKATITHLILVVRTDNRGTKSFQLVFQDLLVNQEIQDLKLALKYGILEFHTGIYTMFRDLYST